MDSIKIETTIEQDGELHLTQLPCRKGDRVEATLSILVRNGENAAVLCKGQRVGRPFMLELVHDFPLT